MSVDYQSTALAIELTGCKFVLGRCSSADRLDIISRPLFGGKGEIRTHTGQRMKLLHNHYATLPYVNTLKSAARKALYPQLMSMTEGLMCLHMVGAQGIEP